MGPAWNDILKNEKLLTPLELVKELWSDNLRLPVIVVIAVVTISIALVVMGHPGDKKKRKRPSGPITLRDADEWQSFELVDIKELSHDVKRFRFALPTPRHVLGLPIGQHISLKFTDKEGKDVQRSYTPVTSDDELGYVDFVIKMYRPNIHPKFPAGGRMSVHLDSLKVGDNMAMKGPKGHLDYKQCGEFTIAHRKTDVRKYHKKKIGLIAGGTGLTPMLQIIRAIKKNPQDKTELWLLLANQTEEDILLREELESLVCDSFHLHYTLDRPPKKWNYSSGFINSDMCKKHLPPPGKDTMIFCCGPPPMIKFACEPSLKEVGFGDDEWFAF